MKIFSVTEVLSPWINEKFQRQGVSQKKLAVASGKGTLVHHWSLSYALGIYAKELPELYQGYGNSYKLWHDEFVIEVIWVEKELIDPELGIKGHPDLLAYLKGSWMPSLKKEKILALPDLKTPVDDNMRAFWQIQLSTYLHLVKKAGWNPDWVGSLQLDPKGGFPKPHRHRFAERDMAIFLSALQVRRYLG
jgi:hypothetical protein